MGNFIEELKRRNVIKASISYVIIAWAVLQAVDILFPMFEIPDVFQKGIFITLIIGFPAFVIFAYVFESTPTGFKRTESVAPEKSIHKETSQKLNRYIIGGLIVAVLLLVADRQFDLAENITGESEARVDMSSIAVLPFENLSGPDDEYFTAGVTEDILTHISRIKDLRVLSRFTLKEYDRSGKTIKQVGQELGVGYVLTGSIRRAGDDLRISCQLVEIETEQETWAQNFDKEMIDVFAIQNEVATEVASYLKANLTEEEKAQLSDRRTDNLVAYNYYLKGREEWNKYNPEAAKRALTYFEQALKLDPNFADAYSGMADAIGSLIDYRLGDFDSLLEKRKSFAEKAVKLNPNSEEAHMAMANIYNHLSDWELMNAHAELALKINPNYERALAIKSFFYAVSDRLDKSILAQKEILSVNPIRWQTWNNMASDYTKLGMYNEAEQAFEKAIKLNPDNQQILYGIVLLQIRKNEFKKAKNTIRVLANLQDEAIFNIESACDLSMLFDQELAMTYANEALSHPDFDTLEIYTVSLNIGRVLWAKGKIDSAKYWLDPIMESHKKSVENGNTNIIYRYNLMQNHAIRGETDEALKWMREDLDLGDLELVWLNRDPTLDNIRDEPRFKAMIQEIEDKLRKMRLDLSAQEDRDRPKV